MTSTVWLWTCSPALYDEVHGKETSVLTFAVISHWITMAQMNEVNTTESNVDLSCPSLPAFV